MQTRKGETQTKQKIYRKRERYWERETQSDRKRGERMKKNQRVIERESDRSSERARETACGNYHLYRFTLSSTSKNGWCHYNIYRNIKQ